jgi:hypothetical protein
MVTRLVALSIVLVLSGVPALTVLCEGWCPMAEHTAASTATAECHEHAPSSVGPRVASRHHDCDHQLSVTAAVVTEVRHTTVPFGSSLAAVLETSHPTIAAARMMPSFSGLRGSPPGSAPSSFSVLRI